MRKKPSLYPGKRMSPEREGWETTSLGESSFILKRSLQHLSEGFPPNTKDTKKYLAKKSHRGYLDILYGTTLSNCSQGPPHRYQGGSSPLPRAKSRKLKNL